MLNTVLDVVTTATGAVATTIFCFFPGSKKARTYAFLLYIIANSTLALLAYRTGIEATAVREVWYLILSFVGLWRNK